MSANDPTELEPTLHDVMDVLKSMDKRIEGRLDGIDNRLDAIDTRIGAVERRVGAVEIKMEDMQETLDAVARAVDADAVTLINHERRIKDLGAIA